MDDYVAKHNRKKKKAKISRDSCDLVGVHVRRRDHLQYEERMKYSKLNKNYFLQSMDLYKERLSHPIFLIVTDDPDWVRTQIPHHYFNHYTTGSQSITCNYCYWDFNSTIRFILDVGTLVGE